MALREGTLLIDANVVNDWERSQLLNQWRSPLTQVRKLARQQRKFLLKEIDEIIQHQNSVRNTSYVLIFERTAILGIFLRRNLF